MTINTAPVFGRPSFYEAGNTNKQGVDLQLLAGGYIFGASTSSNYDGSMWLWRLDASGTPDAAFFFGSPLLLGEADNHPRQAVVQADDEVVVAFDRYTNGQIAGIELRRIDSDGQFDTTFGGNGIAALAVPATSEGVRTLTLQADGKFLVGWYASSAQFVLTRLNADGSVDSAFGTAGRITDSFISPMSNITPTVHVGADGDISIVFAQTRQIWQNRLNADGSDDAAFDAGWQAASAPYGSAVRATSFGADGSALILAHQDTGNADLILIERLGADGRLDNSFGTAGLLTVSVPTFEAFAIAKQADGKLLVAGDVFRVATYTGALLRLNADGTVDTAFGSDGVATAPFLTTRSSFDAVTVQSDGEIVVTGAIERFNGTFYDGDHNIVLRFNADGTVDSSFDNTPDGPWFAAYTPGLAPTVLDPAASIYDADLAMRNNYGMTLLTLQRHGDANADDHFGSAYFTDDGNVDEAGIHLGVESQAGGQLQVYFWASPTQGQLDEFLRSITYRNGAANAFGAVQLDWTFDDASGAPNASVTRTTTVWITNVHAGTANEDRLAVDGPDQMLDGKQGNDSLTGAAANDLFSGGAGKDSIDGGAGLDRALYTGNLSQYTIAHSVDGTFVVSDKTLTDGADTLAGVERLQFADAKVALDIDGNAGQVYRLYQAAFGRVPDLPGLGYQINELDTHLTLAQVAANFIASPEFQQTYGSVNDTQFITLLYRNVLHREPDGGGLEYHLGELARGELRADVLTHFSESPENQANVIGAIEDGIVYIL